VRIAANSKRTIARPVARATRHAPTANARRLDLAAGADLASGLERGPDPDDRPIADADSAPFDAAAMHAGGEYRGVPFEDRPVSDVEQVPAAAGEIHAAVDVHAAADAGPEPPQRPRVQFRALDERPRDRRRDLLDGPFPQVAAAPRLDATRAVAADENRLREQRQDEPERKPKAGEQERGERREHREGDRTDRRGRPRHDDEDAREGDRARHEEPARDQRRLHRPGRERRAPLDAGGGLDPHRGRSVR
jgi:hypothetical protein